jgi:hypothetical protein
LLSWDWVAVFACEAGAALPGVARAGDAAATGTIARLRTAAAASAVRRCRWGWEGRLIGLL